MQEFFSHPVFQETFFQNTILDYTIALGIFLVLGTLIKFFHVSFINKLQSLSQKTKNDVDDIFLKALKTIKPAFYVFLSFYLSLKFLQLNAFFQTSLDFLLLIWATYQAILIASITIDYSFKKFVVKENGESKSALEVLGKIIKAVLWLLGILLILSNLGINITSLIAGLGIGGIAIALALQNILGDLFSSFAIYFDKPFKVGDFIIVGDKMGVVEKIGIKTTRIRALQGEEIVLSNQELTSSQIQNFKKMQERRVVFSFGVVYQTPQKKLKKIPGMIKEIISKTKLTRFDRAHFQTFGDSALVFEIVYYVQSGDYNTYMDIQQDINFAISEQFEKENISMAYPTQTIYLTK